MPNENLHVLIVDANPVDAASLRENIFREAGTNIEIKIADNLSAAQDELGRGAYDVIVLDLQLPDSHGLRALSTINQLSPATPVFILTGIANPQLMDLALRKGAQDYFLKRDFSGQSLREIIKRVVDGEKVRRPVRAYGELSILDHKRVLEVLSKYVSPELRFRAIAEVRRGGDTIEPEILDLTVMFVDIVGFTEMSEKEPLLEIINLLNESWEVVTSSITALEGYVDKYMGDAVMALFYEPLKAVQAAVEIQSMFFQVNHFRQLSGLHPVLLRIGLNSGRVVRANVGTKIRMDWTPVGNVVNTASRIQRYAGAGQVWIGQATYEAAREFLKISRQEVIELRGKASADILYNVESVHFENDGLTRTLFTTPALEDFDHQ